MKKILIVLLLLFFVSGCASSSASESGNSGDDIHAVEPVIEEEEDGIDRLYIGNEGKQDGELVIDRGYGYDYDYDVSKLHYEDFEEFYAQIMYEGLPEDKVREPLGNANGVWKYDFVYRYDSSDGGYVFEEIGYADMSVHNYDDPPVRITLHPRYASDGYEVWEESDEQVGYEPFGGGFDEFNNLKLYGNDCVLLLQEFYAWEGREYLLAELWMSEEDVATFMMIRGQE